MKVTSYFKYLHVTYFNIPMITYYPKYFNITSIHIWYLKYLYRLSIDLQRTDDVTPCTYSP